MKWYDMFGKKKNTIITNYTNPTKTTLYLIGLSLSLCLLINGAGPIVSWTSLQLSPIFVKQSRWQNYTNQRQLVNWKWIHVKYFIETFHVIKVILSPFFSIPFSIFHWINSKPKKHDRLLNVDVISYLTLFLKIKIYFQDMFFEIYFGL